MLRSWARLCSLRPRAEEYGPRPISACFFGILFVLILFFSKGFSGFVFYRFAGIFSPHGFFGFARKFSYF
jgi:hypothetical protein